MVAREGDDLEATALIAEVTPELLSEIKATFGERLYLPGVAAGAKRLLRSLSRDCATSRCPRKSSCFCPNRKDALVAACHASRLDLLRLLIREGGPLFFREFKAALMASYETGDYDLANHVHTELRAALLPHEWHDNDPDKTSDELAVRGALLGGSLSWRNA